MPTAPSKPCAHTGSDERVPVAPFRLMRPGKGTILDDMEHVYATATTDASGMVTGWSEGARRLTGRTAEEVVGRAARELLAEDPPVRSAVDIFVKDATLVAEAADTAGFDAALLTVAASRFRATSAAGLGRADDSGVITTYRTGAPTVPGGAVGTAGAADPGVEAGRASVHDAHLSKESGR